IATGARQFANPHLDVQNVLRLWRLSIDDPNPEASVSEPVWEHIWGRFNDFDVSLNGMHSGAVFLGDKTTLHIERKAGRLGGVDLEVYLNDAPLKTFKNTGTRTLHCEFDSPAGLNSLT